MQLDGRAGLDRVANHPHAAAIALRCLAALEPPRKISVGEAAERYRYLRNPGGGYTGPWHNDEVPYLIEPGDMVASRRKRGVVFVGPAQSGKTDHLIVNATIWGVMCDPADTMIVQPTEAMARDFSVRRLDRMLRDCADVAARLDVDNTFDKSFVGMMLTIGHPSISQLSGRAIPRLLLTDYDRMPDDVGGEGAPFDLAWKRGQTFGSRAVTLAESSPGRPLLRGKAQPQTPHEAPPATGILALYNRGDRRRWYWPCPHCAEYFEGGFGLLHWPKEASPADAAAAVTMGCLHCGVLIEPRHKAAMNAVGVWVPDGCTIDQDGNVHGAAPAGDIASYWMKGTAAAFQTWGQLVKRYLDAVAEFEATGDEQPLKVTVNTDQAEPYLDKAQQAEASVDVTTLAARAEPYPFRVVPAAARLLIASVDVQKSSFEIQVRAFGPGLESWIVDRFQLFKAVDGDGAERGRAIDPAAHDDDWDQLLALLDRAYPVAGDAETGRPAGAFALRPFRLIVDSAGAAGVTERAYRFWRRARQLGHGNRVLLAKGDNRASAPRVSVSFPDSKRKDRKALARGEVPVVFFNTDLLKDALVVQLSKEEPGPHYLHLPRALCEGPGPHAYLEQLTAEERRPSGRWHKVKQRNEAIDLNCLAHAAALQAAIEKVDWSRPPAWAAPAESNNYAIAVGSVPGDDAEPAGGADPAPDPATPARTEAPSGRRPRRQRGKGFVNNW